jgi:hypothetical protein
MVGRHQVAAELLSSAEQAGRATCDLDRDGRFEMLLDIFLDGLARRARVQNGERRSSSG